MICTYFAIFSIYWSDTSLGLVLSKHKSEHVLYLKNERMGPNCFAKELSAVVPWRGWVKRIHRVGGNRKRQYYLGTLIKNR